MDTLYTYKLHVTYFPVLVHIFHWEVAGAKLVVGALTSPLREMMRPCRCFPHMRVKCQPSHITGQTSFEKQIKHVAL
jgi:hypothetical protein